MILLTALILIALVLMLVLGIARTSALSDAQADVLYSQIAAARALDALDDVLDTLDDLGLLTDDNLHADDNLRNAYLLARPHAEIQAAKRRHPSSQSQTPVAA